MLGCYSYKSIGNNYKDSDPMLLKIKLKNNDVMYLNYIIAIETIEDHIVFIDNRLGQNKILVKDIQEISIGKYDLTKFFLNTILIIGGLLLILYLVVMLSF